MKKELTARGFGFYEFQDRLKIKCQLQKSSIATQDCIWLGTVVDRMHLTQEHVKELLPILQKFVEAGEI